MALSVTLAGFLHLKIDVGRARAFFPWSCSRLFTYFFLRLSLWPVCSGALVHWPSVWDLRWNLPGFAFPNLP